MLRNLHVKNLALMDEAEVEFQEGLNILSGETGAGKSILIGSLNLALGEKVPKELLRENQEAAMVELIFTVEDEALRRKLLELDVFPEEDQVILSRKITQGRSIARINSESVSVSRMKEVASLLVDLHGQHEHQSLLQKKKHLEILDSFSGPALEERKEALAAAYKSYRGLEKEYEKARGENSSREREIAFLEYEINEIEAAKLTLGEDEALEEEYRRLVHGKRIQEAVAAAYRYTGGSDSAENALDRGLRELSVVSSLDPQAEEFYQQLTELDNLLSDFNRSLSDYQSQMEFSGEDFHRVEERLNEINHLKSKYGSTIEEIFRECEKKEERRDRLQNLEEYCRKLKEQLEQKEKELTDISLEMRTIRKRMAIRLCELIRQSLLDLNFLDVQFSMEFSELSDFTANGLDEARFLISTNPGEALRPLDKIASGGELSRIMLAIKTILAENDAIETMIFDEIDTGISGRTAQAVAEKMHLIAKHHQVLCITHLPQIAAMADHHFLIEKAAQNNVTHSTITPLSEEERITELARMLGGVKVTETVLESAREMRRMAQDK